MAKYFDELVKAMDLCADQFGVKFIGQNCSFQGTALYNTIRHIHESGRYEFPVAENMQLGVSLGLALVGFFPVSIFARMDFLIESCSQLVSHLDKFPLYAGISPKVIIRTAIGSRIPLDPQAQHRNDYCEGLRSMLKTIPVIRLDSASMILSEYEKAIKREGSTILVEWADKYNTDD